MIFSAFERLVAFRYLRARRREGFVSVIAGFSLLGIAVGVATLIIVTSVMNGFRDELLGRILALNGHVGVYGVGGTLTDFDALAGRIRDIPGVRRVTPTIEGQVMAAAAKAQPAGAIVRGVRPEDLLARHAVASNVDWWRRDAFEAGDGVLVGVRLAEKLALAPGDRITLISPKGTPTAFGTVPRMRAYPVAGTFEAGMYEYDNAFVFMPLPAAQLFFRLPDAVTHLEVFADSPQRALEVRRDIYQATGGNVRIYDWQQANAGFFAAVEVERNVMFLILALIIVVAAFNIISSLILLVKDKGRAVAILRTMGATRAMVMRIFLIDGAAIGVVGTAAGVALGLLVAFNIEGIRRWIQDLTGAELFSAEIYFLTELPARVDAAEVAAVAAMALGLSFAATLYPSWRAARLDPVEALRYE